MNDEMKQKMIYDLALEYVKQKKLFESQDTTGQNIDTIGKFCREVYEAIDLDDNLQEIFK